MAFSNYRKETSERSDRVNWTKQVLIQSTPYHFDAMETCNQSNLDLVVYIHVSALVSGNL